MGKETFSSENAAQLLMSWFGNEHEILITSILLGIAFSPEIKEEMFQKIASFYVSEVKSKEQTISLKEKIKKFLENVDEELDELAFDPF